MKRLIACALLTVLASETQAVIIDTAGLHIIDSEVDELIVDSSLSTADVMIQVVSGGVVQNNIVCSGGAGHCDFRVTVSGNGAVMGRVLGAGAQIDIRDDAQVGFAGAQRNDGGKVTVSDHAHVGAISGAGSGILGDFEINGGRIDHFMGGPQSLVMSMNGGVIDDNVSAWGMSLDLRGGEILGDLRSQEFQLGLRMRDGHIAGDLIGSEGLQGFIEGGAIDGDLRASVGGVLDISGGLFGGGATSLWSLGGAQVMNVWGWDLLLTDSRLTGYLLDGSRLDVDVAFSQTFSGALNLHNVPEPDTLALFGLGLLAVFFARRKSPQRRRLCYT